MHICKKTSNFVAHYIRIMSQLDKSVSPINHAMLFGLELGIWFGANFIVSALGHGLLSWFILFYIVYFISRCVMHYRENECGDSISFSHAYRYVLWLFFFASLVGAMVKVIYLKWINPEYLGEVYRQTMELVKESHVPGEMITQLQNSLQNVLQPVRFSVYYLLFDILSGVFCGPFFALFVIRRGKKNDA